MGARSPRQSVGAFTQPELLATLETLDPPDWSSVSALAHRIIDDAVGHLGRVRERPVWQPLPDEIEALYQAPVPDRPTPLEHHALERLPLGPRLAGRRPQSRATHETKEGPNRRNDVNSP